MLINSVRSIRLIMKTEAGYFVVILGDWRIAAPLLQLWAA